MAESKIGLVLDGGGGKGAYQIGVWKALRETGLDKRIVQIAGTSVGGLNAALMIQGDYHLAEEIWFKEIENLKPTRIHMWVSDIMDKYLDFSVFSTSPIECWIAATCVSPKTRHISCVEPAGELVRIYKCGKTHYFNMRGCTAEERKTILQENTMNRNIMLATCALPILCTSKRIDGLLYRDGGITDNSPLRPLAEVPRIWDKTPKCDFIIVIHLDPVRYDQDPMLRIGPTLLQITPNTKMGGILKGTINFRPQNTKRLAEAGYYDSLPLFQTFLENEMKIQQIEEMQERQQLLLSEQMIRDAKALEICDRVLRKEPRHERNG